jgi:hypothetical protein
MMFDTSQLTIPSGIIKKLILRADGEWDGHVEGIACMGRYAETMGYNG